MEIAPASLSVADRALIVGGRQFSDFRGLYCGSTTREFSEGLPEGTSRVTEMRRVCEVLGQTPVVLAWGEQKHTNHVATITAEMAERNAETGQLSFANTDAMVTACPGVALAIQTADCAPILLFDPKTRIIGIAHAGWRGTYAGIAEATVAAMGNLGAHPRDIRAWIGPMAGGCCYEVSPELVSDFRERFSDFPAEEISGGRMLNLVSVNTHQLLRAGLQHEHIEDSGICTIHHQDRFYSYRASGPKAGRIISVILMTNG